MNFRIHRSMISVIYDTCSSDILLCFRPIVLYSVVDSSNLVSLLSSLIDVAASNLSRKQVFRIMILQICLLFAFN